MNGYSTDGVQEEPPQLCSVDHTRNSSHNQLIWAEAAPEHGKMQQFTPKCPRRHHQVQVNPQMAPAVTSPRANTALQNHSSVNKSWKQNWKAPGTGSICKSTFVQLCESRQGEIPAHTGSTVPAVGWGFPGELSITLNYLCCKADLLVLSLLQFCTRRNPNPITEHPQHPGQAPFLRSQLSSLAARRCEGSRAGSPGQQRGPDSPCVPRAASSSHLVQLRASCRLNRQLPVLPMHFLKQLPIQNICSQVEHEIALTLSYVISVFSI